MEFAGSLGDGVLTSDRLLAEIPFIRMTGTGALDLANKTMDYHLQAKVFETPTFEDGTTLKDLTGLAIPLTLKGPMDKPKAGVDLKELATGVATEKLREKLLKKFGLEEQPVDGAATGSTGAPAQPATAPAKEEKPRDALKRALQDLLKPKP
jgi:AsmA protein